jgi:hypothetical protein
MGETIRIDLTDKLGTHKGLSNDALFQGPAFRTVYRHLSDVAEHLKEICSPSGKILEIHECRIHDTIFIDGPRGSGKTTFILNLSEKKLRDTWWPRDLEQNFFFFLPPIDPTLIEGKIDILSLAIAHIHTIVQEEDAKHNGYHNLHPHSFSPMAGGESRACQYYHNAIQEVAQSIFRYNEKFDTDSYDPMWSIIHKGFELEIEKKFHAFLDAARLRLNIFGFILPIDDVDMAAGKGFDVLDTIRRFFSSPFITCIVTGSMEMYELIVDKYFDKGIGERQSKCDKSTVVDPIPNLRDAFLKKLFPIHRRVKLRSVSELLQEHRIELAIRDGRQSIDLEVYNLVVNTISCWGPARNPNDSQIKENGWNANPRELLQTLKAKYDIIQIISECVCKWVETAKQGEEYFSSEVTRMLSDSPVLKKYYGESMTESEKRKIFLGLKCISKAVRNGEPTDLGIHRYAIDFMATYILINPNHKAPTDFYSYVIRTRSSALGHHSSDKKDEFASIVEKNARCIRHKSFSTNQALESLFHNGNESDRLKIGVDRQIYLTPIDGSFDIKKSDAFHWVLFSQMSNAESHLTFRKFYKLLFGLFDGLDAFDVQEVLFGLTPSPRRLQSIAPNHIRRDDRARRAPFDYHAVEEMAQQYMMDNLACWRDGEAKSFASAVQKWRSNHQDLPIFVTVTHIREIIERVEKIREISEILPKTSLSGNVPTLEFSDLYEHLVKATLVSSAFSEIENSSVADVDAVGIFNLDEAYDEFVKPMLENVARHSLTRLFHNHPVVQMLEFSATKEENFPNVAVTERRVSEIILRSIDAVILERYKSAQGETKQGAFRYIEDIRDAISEEKRYLSKPQKKFVYEYMFRPNHWTVRVFQQAVNDHVVTDLQEIATMLDVPEEEFINRIKRGANASDPVG